MLAIVNNQSINLKVTSHILESDPLNPDLYNMFHCWRCGKKVMQFSGDCIMSTPGGTNAFLPILVMCQVCKQRHLFNSIL